MTGSGGKKSVALRRPKGGREIPWDWTLDRKNCAGPVRVCECVHVCERAHVCRGSLKNQKSHTYDTTM